MSKPARKASPHKPSPLQSGKVLLSTIVIFAIAIILPILFLTRGFDTGDLRGDAATDPNEFLKAQGKDLTYKGVKVTLRGVNFDNIGALGADIGTNNSNDISITESDYQQLSALGGNHARLGMAYTWWKDNPTQFFSKIDQQVAWAKKHQIFLLLLTFTNPDGGNGCYEGYGNTCGMWSNSGQQTELLNFWKAIAARYKDEPAVIGYDLVNEPTPSGSCGTWFNIAQNWINQLTPIAPNQLYFIEACSDPSFDRTFKNASGAKATNVVYETHDYVPLGMTHSGYNPPPGNILTYPGTASAWIDGVQKTITWNKGTWEGSTYPAYSTRKDTAKEWADNNDVPIYIGEWGTQSFLNGYTTFIRDKGDVYNKLGLNHAYYTWKHDISGGWRWGMIATNGSGVDQAKIDAVKTTLVGSIKPTFGGGVPNVPSPTAAPSTAPSPVPSPTPTIKPPSPTPGTSPKPPSPSPSSVPTIKPTALPSPIVTPNPPSPSPSAPTNPAGYPRQLQSSNSKIKVWEVLPPQGNKIFLRVDSDGSFTPSYTEWYLNRRWTTVDRAPQYFLGGDVNGAPVGYTLPSGTTEVRSVVYYSGDQYYDTFTNYTTGTAPQPTPVPTPGVSPKPASPVPSPTPVPSTSVTGLIDIFNEWPQGYCARIVVKNGTSRQVKNWSVNFRINQANFTSKWNASFTNVLGTIFAIPSASTSYLPAFGSNSTVDWCANKTGTNWRPSNLNVIAL